MSLTKREPFIAPSKGKLILTRELLDEINFLHDKVGRKEWCGILFYRHIEGDITDPKSLVLQAEHLYMMDIGSEAYTDADIDTDAVIEMDDVIPDVRNLKKGLIHTHHTMSAFFSWTDMSELEENTPFHNYYLSLIVNFSGDYVAKVAYIAKRTSTVEYKNVHDEVITKTSETEVLAQIDMDIHWETPEVVISDYFRTRYEHIKQEKAAKVRVYTNAYLPGRAQTFGGTSQVSGNDRGSYDWGKSISTKQTEIPFITTGGKLQVGDKQLRPLGEVEAEIGGALQGWLSNGIAEFTQGGTTDVTISGLLAYLEEYFDMVENQCDYPFFLNQMQRSTETAFSQWRPGLVSTICYKIMDKANEKDGGVAVDLMQMMDSFDDYVATMSDIALAAEPVDMKDTIKVNKSKSWKKK